MIDIEKVRLNLKRRIEQKQYANLALFYSAEKDANRIIQMIREKYHPRKILQWGSLLCPGNFNEHSDIDIAISGIKDAETFFAILRDSERMTDFPLDIVDYDTLLPEFAESIRVRSKVVYEQC